MLQTMLGVFVLFLALLLVKGQMMPSSGGNPSSSALATLLQLQAMSGRPGAGGPPGATLPTPPGAADFGSAAGGGMSPLALAAAGGGGGSSSLGTLGLLSLLGSSQGEGRGNMMQNLMMIQQYGLDNWAEYNVCQRMLPRNMQHMAGMMCMRYLF